MWAIIEPILITAVTAILSYVGLKLRTLFEEYVNTKTKEDIVKNTVQYVEQVFETLDGASKLQEAKRAALNWLNEKGIQISDTELTILIESSVKALKGGFYKAEHFENQEANPQHNEPEPELRPKHNDEDVVITEED